MRVKKRWTCCPCCTYCGCGTTATATLVTPAATTAVIAVVAAAATLPPLLQLPPQPPPFLPTANDDVRIEVPPHFFDMCLAQGVSQVVTSIESGRCEPRKY